MRSLFLKMFIWFWLGMILAMVALFFAFAAMRPTPSNRPWRDLSLMGSTAQKAAETFDREGQAALAGYLNVSDWNETVQTITSRP